MKRKEKTLGKTHPSTLMTVMNIALVYEGDLKNYVKATEYFERGVKGFEAQLGKEHEYTKKAAEQLKICLELSGNTQRLGELKKEYPGL